MAFETPQWQYGTFLFLDLIPILGFVACGIVLVLGRLISHCFCSRSQQIAFTGEDSTCSRFGVWFFKDVIKPLVLHVFKETLQESCGSTATMTTSRHLEPTKRLKLGDIFVKPAKQQRAVEIFFCYFFVTLMYGAVVFWDSFLFNVTVGTDCLENQACFLTFNLSLSSPPLDCDSSSIYKQICLHNDVLSDNSCVVFCYDLVLEYASAAGIATGLFKFTILIIRISCAIFMRLWKKAAAAEVIVRISLSLLVISLWISETVTSSTTYSYDNNPILTTTKIYMGIVPFAVILVVPVSSALHKQVEQQRDVSRSLINPVNETINAMDETINPIDETTAREALLS